jgi:hypothetical protein
MSIGNACPLQTERRIEDCRASSRPSGKHGRSATWSVRRSAIAETLKPSTMHLEHRQAEQDVQMDRGRTHACHVQVANVRASPP